MKITRRQTFLAGLASSLGLATGYEVRDQAEVQEAPGDADGPWTQVYHPRIITSMEVLSPEGEDLDRKIYRISDLERGPVVAFSVLPEKGDEVVVQMKDGGFAVVEVLRRLHWGVEVDAGQDTFTRKDDPGWVDVTLVCRDRSMSWLSENRDDCNVVGS